MEKLIIKDSSVEKAIQKGLIKLNITLEQAEIKVIEEGKKGLFGFGQKDATIEIALKQSSIEPVKNENSELKPLELETNDVDDNEENILEEKETVKPNVSFYQEVADVLQQIAKEYGAESTISIKETAKKIIFQVESEKMGLLIGKHGKIINALQVIAQTLVYKINEKAPMVIVNIGDYRQKREVKLKEIADRSAKRVLRTKQSLFLEPLPAFERKIIHARLSEYDNITTHSEGKEPYRYLVVEFENH